MARPLSPPPFSGQALIPHPLLVAGPRIKKTFFSGFPYFFYAQHHRNVQSSFCCAFEIVYWPIHTFAQQKKFFFFKLKQYIVVHIYIYFPVWTYICILCRGCPRNYICNHNVFVITLC